MVGMTNATKEIYHLLARILTLVSNFEHFNGFHASSKNVLII